LAEAYRRRAAELDLRAWLEAVWSPAALEQGEALPSDEARSSVTSDRRLELAAA
jgi:hypothetical protein